MNDRPMVAGRATAADGIIRLAGAANAIAEFDGYKIVNDEAMIAARPDAVLAMERGSCSLSADQVFAPPGLCADAGGAAQGVRLDGGALSARLRPAHRARRARSRPRRSIPSLASEHAALRASRSLRPMRGDGVPCGARRLARHRSAAVSCIAALRVAVAVIAATIGAAGIPPRRLAGGARLRRRRAGAAGARPAGAVVDPAAADRARRLGRRAARGRRNA